MKKSILLMVILALILPSAVFAEEPSETEIIETTTAILGSFGLIFMTAMMGQIPEGVELEAEEDSTNLTIVFDEFDVEEYFSMLDDEEGMGMMTEEMPDVYFSEMSGSISVNADGDMSMDVELEGGNIMTLWMETSGEELSEMYINGEDYSYMDSIFDEMSE